MDRQAMKTEAEIRDEANEIISYFLDAHDYREPHWMAGRVKRWREVAFPDRKPTSSIGSGTGEKSE